MVYIPNGVKEGCRVVWWVPRICYCCVTQNMESKEEGVEQAMSKLWDGSSFQEGYDEDSLGLELDTCYPKSSMRGRTTHDSLRWFLKQVSIQPGIY